MSSTKLKTIEPRQEILDAAYYEMWRLGFQAASVDRILKATKLSKGALYHYFPGKRELGYAVLDEIVAELVRARCVEPLKGSPNILDRVQKLLRESIEHWRSEFSEYGEPLAKLALEMAPLDAGFRARTKAVFSEWITCLADEMSRGQAQGIVREGVDAFRAAEFIVSGIQGAAALATAAGDSGIFQGSIETLSSYVESLRT